MYLTCPVVFKSTRGSQGNHGTQRTLDLFSDNGIAMQLKPSLLLWAQIQLLENVSVPTPVTTRNLPISVDHEGNFL